MYPPELVASFRSQYRPNLHGNCEAPPDDVFAQILKVAFYASMEREEGRATKFRIGFCGLETLAQLSAPAIGRHWLPFTKGIPFLSPEIRRLAPALDHTRSFICVHRDARQIDGILTATSDHIFMGTLSKFMGFRLPDIFNVCVADAGELDVNIGASSVVQFRQGELRVPQSFYGVGDPLWDVEHQIHLEALKMLPPMAQERFADARNLTPYPGFLARILFLMERRRHGGSLLVVPDRMLSEVRASGCLRIKYPFGNNPSDIWNLCVTWYAQNRLAFFEDWENGIRGPKGRVGDNPEFPQQLFDTIMRFAEFTATLTSVDGAVVMSERLEVIGFGAEITSAASEVPEVTMHDDRSGTGEVRNVEDNGMRHRSVYRFCKNFPNAMGIIVSQDGGIKVVKSKEGAVHVWKNVTPSIM